MKKDKKAKTKASVSASAAHTDAAQSIGSLGIRPLADRIVVKPLAEEHTKTPSGIIIPDTVSKEKPEQGTVVAIGPGKVGEDGKRIPVALKVGDTVLFSKYGYDEVKIAGQEYFILREEAILAVMK
jgi:chaperonin GroES